jgi:hypothetical protein
MAKNRPNPIPFKITTHLDSGFGTEKPPKSAKLVAQVSWSWGPANSRVDRYLICADRKRRAWILWSINNDDYEQQMYARIAMARPHHGYTAKFAAEQLLIACWKSELKMWETDLSGGRVDKEGLLEPISKLLRAVDPL